MIERVPGAACHFPQPTLEIVLESLRKSYVGDIAARHAYEVMVMTECELGELVPRSVFLHTRNAIDDTGSDEDREVPVQRTLDEAAARLQ